MGIASVNADAEVTTIVELPCRDHDKAWLFPVLRGCRRGRELVPVVGIGTVDGNAETLESPANIDSPEWSAGLGKQVLEILHPFLQPALAVTEVVVDHMGVLGSLRVPEDLALPVAGERGRCSEFPEPLFVLGGLIDGCDKRPARDGSIETRVVEDPFKGLADLPLPARGHGACEALDLVDVVAVGVGLANVETSIALRRSAPPGGRSLLKATGCLVPFCGCAGGCGIPAPAARLPEPGGLV